MRSFQASWYTLHADDNLSYYVLRDELLQYFVDDLYTHLICRCEEDPWEVSLGVCIGLKLTVMILADGGHDSLHIIRTRSSAYSRQSSSF